MFIAAFRILCMLLLATIILDVTNTRCFKNSLTYKYSKQFGAFQYGKTVAKFMGEGKDKFMKAWRGKEFYEIHKVSTNFKEIARIYDQWFANAINNFNLLLETLQNYLNEKRTHEYTDTLSTAHAVERKTNPGNVLE